MAQGACARFTGSPDTALVNAMNASSRAKNASTPKAAAKSPAAKSPKKNLPQPSAPQTPDAGPGEEKAAYLLRQVAERLGISLTHALRPFNQSPGVYRVLIALTRRNPVKMRELIDLTMIEASVLSRTVARMKAQDLVRVTAADDDARSLLIHATDQGRATLEAMLPAVSAQYEWAVHDVPAADLEVMRVTLQRMLHNLKISPIK